MTLGRLKALQDTTRARCLYMALWSAMGLLLAVFPGRTADLPTLVILPLELVDTSGEIPPKAQDDRLARLTGYLSAQVGMHGLYTMVDPTPIGAEIDRARAGQRLDRCNGCERDLARLAHADRVLIGEVDKVSTLIGSLRLNIVNVATGQSVFARQVGFRGDSDDAWQHAVRFFVRDLAEAAASER
jgi:hypothetical protein